MEAAARGFAVMARAKFNIRLEIGAKRQDGFHALRSVVADLAVGDEVRFEGSSAFSVDCDDPAIDLDANLGYVAALNLDVDLPAVAIHIKKHLPQQAGLGGGSADAAAALRGLARVAAEAGRPIAAEALLAAAIKAGSDVAACLYPGLKVVEGRGEKVRQLDFGPPAWGVLLLKPKGGVDTKTGYQLLDAARVDSAGDLADDDAIERLVAALERRDFASACALAHNDFQKPVEAAYPTIARTRERIEAAGAAVTLLCGSGSCVAGLFETVDAARTAAMLLTIAEGEWSCVTSLTA
ncbi:MAG TPA: 4-(cytidine 5'-diphospho)-2-C-methyl-D-erythritol kinase [Candidatus Eremiobacteraceae bacterium]|nr:4-(cytidine 5'-diphospho)-2-C-methyl-D-erythritol kinase [Candidatus Eremiobacteraceae bacterium]